MEPEGSLPGVLEDVYGFWTNKGGVGKTTLCYHTVIEYAQQFPAKKVVVIDADPQANLSMILLNGVARNGVTGRPERISGAERVISMQDEAVQAARPGRHGCTDTFARTIVGYMACFGGLLDGETQAKFDREDFLTHVSQLNPLLPENIYLLCGDSNLNDWQYYIAEQRHDNTWKVQHKLLSSFLEKVALNWEGQKVVAFLDTNPALTSYTEVALLAVKKLIVPVNADDFSISAVKHMFHSVYGSEEAPTLSNKIVEKEQRFANKAVKLGFILPKIHMVINNKAKIKRVQAVRAFEVMGLECVRGLWSNYIMTPTHFEQQVENGDSDLNTFRTAYLYTFRDMYGAGVMSAHFGAALNQLYGPANAETRMMREVLNETFGNRWPTRVAPTARSAHACVKNLVKAILLQPADRLEDGYIRAEAQEAIEEEEEEPAAAEPEG
jgi:cellulose biosynthesis protein BcsQ